MRYNIFIFTQYYKDNQQSSLTFYEKHLLVQIWPLLALCSLLRNGVISWLNFPEPGPLNDSENDKGSSKII